MNETFIGLSTLTKYEVLSYVKDLLLCGPSKAVVIEAGNSIGKLLDIKLIDRDLYVGTCFEYTIKSLKSKDKGRSYCNTFFSCPS